MFSSMLSLLCIHMGGYTNIEIYIYIYIYLRECVCVCMCVRERARRVYLCVRKLANKQEVVKRAHGTYEVDLVGYWCIKNTKCHFSSSPPLFLSKDSTNFFSLSSPPLHNKLVTTKNYRSINRSPTWKKKKKKKKGYRSYPPPTTIILISSAWYFTVVSVNLARAHSSE